MGTWSHVTGWRGVQICGNPKWSKHVKTMKIRLALPAWNTIYVQRKLFAHWCSHVWPIPDECANILVYIYIHIYICIIYILYYIIYYTYQKKNGVIIYCLVYCMLSFIDHKSIMIQEPPFCRLLGEAHVSVLQRTLNEWKAHLEAPLRQRPLALGKRWCWDVCMFANLPILAGGAGGATFVSFELFDPHPCHSRILWWSELRVSLWPCRCWWMAYWQGAHPHETCTRVCTRNLAFHNRSHHFKFKDQPWTTMVFCPILWDAWQAGMRFCLRDLKWAEALQDPSASIVISSARQFTRIEEMLFSDNQLTVIFGYIWSRTNFIFPGFVNRHGENHGKKNRDPGFIGKTHGFGTYFRTCWAFRTAKGQHELAERKELAELGQLQRQLQEALAKVAAWRKRWPLCRELPPVMNILVYNHHLWNMFDISAIVLAWFWITIH